MLYAIKKLGLSILTLFMVATITFFLMHMVPGGPFTGARVLPPAIVHNMEVKYGLNQPIAVQYLKYLESITKGDLGVSIKQQGQPVRFIIGQYFPVSFRLGALSVFIVMLVGTLLGTLAAVKQERKSGKFLSFLFALGVSVPSFVVAIVSMVLFGVTIHLLPTYGIDSAAGYLLPSLSLSVFPLCFVARLVCAGMLNVFRQDYVKTARAKGLPERTVVFKHALKNAFLPVLTYFGPMAASILTGSFVVERIFTIPGLGKYFVDSISNRDYPVIMGTTLFYAAFLIGLNYLVDMLYAIIDPRIRIRLKGEDAVE